MSIRRLFVLGQLALAALATPAAAQDGKVSPTGLYRATLTCGGGVATAPGPNGENYTNAGINLWDAAGQNLSRPVITCGQSRDVGGTGAATMEWLIFVFDRQYTLVKQCDSQGRIPAGAARFTCKTSGGVSATLAVRPR